VSPGRALILVENLSVPLDRRVWQECRALRDADWEVAVVCPQGQSQDQAELEVLEGVEIRRYPVTTAAGGASGYLREYGPAFWHTRRLARSLAAARPFDVVQACNPPDLLFLAALAQRRRGARFVFDQHDLVPELYLSRFGRGRDTLYRAVCAAERLTFRLAHVVISTNESYRHVALTRGRKKPEDVFVVRSAPDLGRFSPVAADAALKNGKPYLLAYLGVMGPQDGIDYALRALTELRARRQDWHMIFLGGGDVLPQMRELARGLGLADQVTFTGRVPDEEVQRVLSTADLCLAPDPKNPLNDVSTMNKILEYMAMARPVVAFDLVEARTSAGEAALYAEPNDVADFARAIETLLDDEPRRRMMGDLGRERVGGPLSWDRSREAYLAAYDRALAGGAQRRVAAA
jgi:glycosyltransferase involved in cell wall biosynthesis